MAREGHVIAINSLGERADREGGTWDLAFTVAIFLTMLTTGVLSYSFQVRGEAGEVKGVAQLGNSPHERLFKNTHFVFYVYEC